MSSCTAGMLAGRTALVMGATGGIGQAISAGLGLAGARLVLAGRDLARLGELRTALGADGVEAEVARVDVTDHDAVASVVAGIEAGLDIAVNNVASSHLPTPLAELDLDDFDRVLAVSLRGVAVAMKFELAALHDGGAIVNVASSAGLGGAPGMSGYVAAKHGVIGLTRTAALDYASRGIRVNAVAPGPIESGKVMNQPEAVRTQIGRYVPLGRMGLAREVADAVVWLASPLASYTTGTVLTVDGGKRA